MLSSEDSPLSGIGAYCAKPTVRARAAEIAKLHGEGKTVTEIAREIGISRGSVYNHLRA